MRTYQDPATFIGFNSKTQQFESTVTAAEWAIAHRELDGKPSGTKLYAYCYDTLIKHRDTETINDGDYSASEDEASPTIITLSHTFIFMPGKKVRAISYDKERLISETDEYKTREGITAGEWAFATFNLKDPEKNTDPYRKLPHIQKTPVFINGIELKHSFIKIGDDIFAISGYGFENHGAHAKVKYAVNKNGRYVALKLPKKYKADGISKNEVDIGREIGFLIAETVKKNQSPVYVSKAYQANLYSLVENLEKQLKNTEIAHDRRLQLFAIFARALLETAKAIQTLHEKNILHRDVKTDNVLINYTVETDRVEAALCDFGFAVKSDDGKNTTPKACGSPCHAAPELLLTTTSFNDVYDIFRNSLIGTRNADEDAVYSAASDIYAFSKIITVTTGHLKNVMKTLDNIIFQCYFLPLLDKIQRNTQQIKPTERLSLPVIIQLLTWATVLISGNISSCNTITTTDLMSLIDHFIQKEKEIKQVTAQLTGKEGDMSSFTNQFRLFATQGGPAESATLKNQIDAAITAITTPEPQPLHVL